MNESEFLSWGTVLTAAGEFTKTLLLISIRLGYRNFYFKALFQCKILSILLSSLMVFS
ncbi:hypothetical protein LEP1GSC103_1275 [Leptospira borgpetersenii serovar Javanica str. UI 09931]|uniref:GDT1 family protein n=1 Tax=Leptospira borgpetersenii serovar Javanica str. UI 09931 TaxID=1049767 RepID=A0AAV3J756_LEPBO|nr:hypothetical protein LEP1GSC101_2163 [Leptospira borgpetersenii str. UI 09149]EMN57831.1 hypothetical protein LEP1GSC090_0534 [Leptospira borgpetersenii serovar Javanica str. MK146]EPG56345.1 hypothetical protein LEP1GSC103_1275 [Leptospira borgpetersenii serovar Javanica str. UI 09931]